MGNLVFLLRRDDLAGFAMRFFVLALVLFVSLGVALVLSPLWAVDGSRHVAVCLMAFAIVLPCSVLGQFAGEFPRGPQFAILRLTGSIFGRTGLLLCFLLMARRWDLSNHGFIYYILAFYAIGLLTDVILTSFKTWQWKTSDRLQEYPSSELAAN